MGKYFLLSNRVETPILHFRIMGEGGVVMQEEMRQYAYLEGPCRIEQLGYKGNTVRAYNNGGQLLLTKGEFLEMIQAEMDSREFVAAYFSEDEDCINGGNHDYRD